MDRRIKALGAVFVICFGLLFLQLNNWQVLQANALQHSRFAPKSVTSWYSTPRGEIVSADGATLAYSTKTAAGYVRHYPYGPLFADVTGYFDAIQESDQFGIEAEYNNDLTEHESSTGGLDGLLTESNTTDVVEVTVSLRLQQVAASALGDFLGAIVAWDPQSGAVLAMYSTPTYDPNRLSNLDATSVEKYYAQVANDRPNPSWGSALLNNATAYPLAPGSTFKVITTSTVYDHKSSLLTYDAPVESAISLPDTTSLFHNYGGEACGGMLPVILAQSCDTAYAKLGLDLGAPDLYDEARSFGFDEVPPIDLPAGEVAAANFPKPGTFGGNPPALAYSAIGQEDITETALEDALVAGAIGDDGVIMKPHLMANVVSQDGRVIDRYRPKPWRRATSVATAKAVRTLMVGVTSSALHGTAAGVFPRTLTVAAKTGTAETGSGNCSADWLIATAPAGPGQTPTVAVAAVLPYQPGLTCSDTGAAAAGPRVAQVLEAALSAK